VKVTRVQLIKYASDAQ